jgi:peptidoglycan/xylan/chitin deacetylase (PgdA/CDA1 family)
MKEIGCEIGNHTYSHRDLADLSKKDILSQINKTNKVVKDLIGANSKLVRPPFGSVDSSVRKNVKYPLIMWSLDTEDWKLKDAAKIREVILSQVEEGDIVLLHDIHEFTFEAMKMVIPELIEKGYQLVTVSELAEWNGVKLEKGTKYFEF